MVNEVEGSKKKLNTLKRISLSLSLLSYLQQTHIYLYIYICINCLLSINREKKKQSRGCHELFLLIHDNCSVSICVGFTKIERTIQSPFHKYLDLFKSQHRWGKSQGPCSPSTLLFFDKLKKIKMTN